ncbi:probable U3 small nucleolar RNA-associated protein 11 [Amphibalanus amphitrite]|uniref:probable U3 small nucleolar RNA-associated protein 11 n=1 Tax=Amphibalanus amphitrite TaxID=1232801 RepID=UPI001C9035E5|nr:probable U3 small nucleolar RNA-associated protein 11 [Amphibalanus amphitrite]XP_043239835.1 probable U3 small nucleolar RNA-associated protein 11 [Amphibalanus amphitrite]XP_043239836.1 probable U3 small nucleolar RNA-associated protein 11 [Amphibalanus amphitrite]XP_043239837.1 probable U3 small nucleolar RNA-associated protein 11 [Amphibalanus amphitrite]XP_043239839.1 probable U3 small nucleolar RNA-associated protein 11 [Amphibalanus amphitrite]XP_043239840.1 probable U3 small nucleol
MSSLRNAVKGQKFHRERHQPAARQHLGLLEKKRDYKQRANEENKKKHQLKALKRKALNRNPDEFYFHMVNSRTKEGRHHEVEAGDELPEDQLALLQSQDIRYIRQRRQLETKKLARLTAELHLLDAEGKPKNTHVFFTDDKKQARTLDVAERLRTAPELLDRAYNRPTVEQLSVMKAPRAMDEEQLDRILAEKKARYSELAKRLEREKTLSLMERRMELKRHLQNKKEEAPKKVHPGSSTQAPVYKWKTERKR